MKPNQKVISESLFKVEGFTFKLKALDQVLVGLEPLASANDELKFKTSKSDFLKSVENQLFEYFNFKRKKFDFDYYYSGTLFQKLAWQTLTKIEYGKTITYKKQAELMNSPKAYRAVGNANGKNPLAIVVPCHRVLASAGNLGGYSGGLELKKRLLEIEACIN